MAAIEVVLPKLAPFQEEWVSASQRFRFVAVEGATGTGKTYVFEPELFSEAHAPKDRGDEYWWMAPSIAQARAVYANVKRSIEDAGAAGLYKFVDTTREIHTPEGGILIYKTAEEVDNLFGFRNVRKIVVDEFTRCRIALWPALLSVANKNECHIVFIGNYRGEDTPWHLWIESMKQADDFAYFKTPATKAVEAGIMSASAYATAKATLPDVVFKALYLCEGSSDPSLLVDYAAVSDLWHNEHIEEGQPALICDIALHGSDRFVMHTWKGFQLHDITVLEKRSAPEVTAIIQGKAAEHNVPRSRIVYDADGLGAYLKGYLEGATPYQGGTISIPQQGQKLSYQRLRDQCHFLAAEYINNRGIWIRTTTHREELQAEIYASLRKKGQNAAGQWSIVPKDSTDPPGAKARLGRSPDIFDPIPMRMYLELTTAPKFAEGVAEQAQREIKRIQIRRATLREGNINLRER